MQDANSLDLRYPIGKYVAPKDITQAQRQQWIADIAQTPGKLREIISLLSEDQFNTPYRPGGWTVLQVVHHLPDSHMNAYIRFKLALTEEEPIIKPYQEDRWAVLPDVFQTSWEVSITLLEALHYRWVQLLKAMTPSDFNRTFRHPQLGLIELNTSLGMYAWHSKHHLAHITTLCERMGWNK